MNKEMNEIEKDFKSKGTVTRKFTIPTLFWENEWEADCIANFGNTYYVKMMHDHQFRQTFQATCALMVQDLLELRERVAQLEIMLSNMQNKPKEKASTFGGKING